MSIGLGATQAAGIANISNDAHQLTWYSRCSNPLIPLNSLTANANKDFGGLYTLTQALARRICRLEAGPGSGIRTNWVVLIERGWQIYWYR